MKTKFIRLLAIFAIVGMAFTGCQEDNGVAPKKDNLVNNDRLSTEGMVKYTDLFDAPSGVRLKTNMEHSTYYYKNFQTGHIRPYKVAYDKTHKQIWLAENFKETQFFASRSLQNPIDPDGSEYGYFYFYKDISIKPQVGTNGLRQWGFYYDSLCTDLINVEWRIPTHNDIHKLVQYLGNIERAYSPTIGIDMRYTGWYSDGIWQTNIADCMFWLKDNGNNTGLYTHWRFRSCCYVSGYSPNPHVFFSQSYDYGASSIRLVANE